VAPIPSPNPAIRLSKPNAAGSPKREVAPHTPSEPPIPLSKPNPKGGHPVPCLGVGDRTPAYVARYVPPFQEGTDSLFFESFNRGKRNVLLDVRTDSGRETLTPRNQADLAQPCCVVSLGSCVRPGRG
jgi:hypothetical protein